MNCGFYQSYSTYTRRQPTDLFCNDPFKVQSYNFRYAEKPYCPIQHYQRPETRPSESVQPKPTFETFYENPKYKRHEKAAMNSSYAEHRRRRFLQDFGCILKPVGQEHGTAKVAAQPRMVAPQRERPTVVPNTPLLPSSCCKQNEYLAMRCGKSVTTMRQEEARATTVTDSITRQPERNQSTATFSFASKGSESKCSGCAININITDGSSEPEPGASDLTIQIEADSSMHNNTDNFKVQRQQSTDTQQRASSDSFVIDKRLSKFNLAETRTPIRTAIGARQRSCDCDLIAKREQLQVERQRLELTRQQELAEEQQRARRREQERERLRELERQRDRERLAELEAERERHRLSELVHRECMKKAYEQELRYREEQQQQQQQQQQQAALRTPVVMASHLQTTYSNDRLPGMAPCYVRQMTSAQQSSNSKQIFNRMRSEKPAEQQQKRIKLESQTEPATEPEVAPIVVTAPAVTLERRSSFSSTNNVSIQTENSSSSLLRPSTSRAKEQKLLNLQVNGLPVSCNQPINMRINNLPIRISTSQQGDRDLFLSMRRVRVRNAGAQPNPSSCNRCRHSNTEPCNVKINVHSLRPMRV